MVAFDASILIKLFGQKTSGEDKKKLAKRDGIEVLGCADLDLPPSENQGNLDLGDAKP